MLKPYFLYQNSEQSLQILYTLPRNLLNLNYKNQLSTAENKINKKNLKSHSTFSLFSILHYFLILFVTNKLRVYQNNCFKLPLFDVYFKCLMNKISLEIKSSISTAKKFHKFSSAVKEQNSEVSLQRLLFFHPIIIIHAITTVPCC